jgi:hypothetical protein
MPKSVVTIEPALAPVVVTAPVAIPNIVRLRTLAVESEKSAYGARRNYAAGINDMTDIAWYIDGEKLPKSIQAEKDEYYKALKAIDYTNPSNAWKMVKKYAREDAIARGLFGEIPPELADNGEGGEGEGGEGEGETRDTKTLTLRYVEDLMVLHKASVKKSAAGHEEYTDKVKAAHGHLMQALKAMGVDIGI